MKNVTVSIDDELCRQARHCAVDKGVSLSAWLAELVARELGGPRQDMTLLDALADDATADRDVEFSRAQEPLVGMDFA